MANPNDFPRVAEPIAGTGGYVTSVWYNFFLKLASTESQADLAALYAALAARVAELEADQGLSFQILGQGAINVNGIPQPGGVVIITLQNDTANPGNTMYYGTGPTGVKGWYPVSDTIAVTSDLTKAVAGTGVTTLGLSDLVDNGAGALLAITRDAKGRIAGTRVATITGTTNQINVANGNASAGLPTLSLAQPVLDALAEAITALQPGDVTGPNSVKVTPNGSGGIILNLDNDVASPAALTTYSTNSAGARGWHRPALFESTGVINGGALTINAGNNARFDMAQAVIGYVDWSITPTQPTRVVSTVGPFTAQVVTNIGTANATYVGIQMPAGTIIQQTSPFTNTQRRTIAQIGVLVHSNNVNINAINDQAATIRAGVNQVGDLMNAIGALNLSGNVYSANGANLNINKSAGTIFKMGANFQTSNLDPHVVSLGAGTALTFRYRLSNGVESGDVTNINPNQYESSPGVLTAIPILGNQWHVQRISVFQSGLTRIQYGQALYGSLSAAIQGITTDSFNTEQNIAENGVLRCYLVINRGLLGLLGSATFVSVSKFGATQAGGGIVPIHNDLSGLQGGTSGQYFHLTSAQLAQLNALTSTDGLPEGATNLYFTNERAQDAVGAALVDTPTINLTYDDPAGQISADCSLMLWGGATSTAPAAGVKMISQNNTQSQLFEVITTGTSTVGPDICSTEYANAGGGGLFHVRRARGTLASPSALLAGDIIGGMSGRSYHSGGAFQASGPASIHWVVSENQTPTGFGSYMRFYSTPQGSTTRVERLVITDVGATWSLGSGTFDPKSAAQTQPFGTNTHRFLASAVDEASRITSIGYGTGGTPQINLAHANGTPSAPTAVLNGDQLGLISCIGYTGSTWVSAGLFRYQASQNWSPTANGVDFVLETVINNSTTRSEKLRLWNDGRLSGKALHNNPGSVAGTADQFIASGTYTPTLTNVTNISASVPDVCQWMRVGNVVTVSGTVQIDVIATGTAQLGMSLPISSAFTLPTQGGGTAASNNETLRIRADAVTPNRVIFEAAIKADIANAAFYFSFTYQVV